MRRVRHLVAGAAVGIAAIGVSDVTSEAATFRIRAFGAVLTGAQEVSAQGVPGVGDPDGIGAAGVVIDTGRGTLCYFVAVRRIAPATLAHIHEGAAGVNGGIVVHFDAPDDGFSADCLDIGTTLATRIADNPRGFYVNVHNGEFPGGAVRGQLR